jgi:pimeloyl-ACP methyl ester carboxylesterase
LKRHFVTIDGRWGPRQVHYRRAGTGAVVLLLHQSPQSSREMVPLMERWSAHFTVIAPDTPGYGQSDPLPAAEVTIEDLADALLEFVDAIGARRFGVYGFHTGASIGLALAHRHPERLTAIAANGVVVLTAGERQHILACYLPAVEPRWDGSHLAWLWARLREQTVFFPWHDRALANRMNLDVPPAAALQASLLDFLRAGDHYATAYRAAFVFATERTLPDLRVPALLTAAPSDPLHAHLARIAQRSRAVEIRPADTPPATLDLSLHHLLAHRGDPCLPPAPARPVPGRLWQQMVQTSAGQVRARLALTGRHEPVVALHDVGGSADTIVRLLDPGLDERPAVALDLPGHGETEVTVRQSGPSVRDCADVVAATLSALGLNEIIVLGTGAGALVALDLMRRDATRHVRAGLIDLPLLTDELRRAYRDQGLPSLQPTWHGGHLLLAWHMLRDGRLFFPWFRRTSASARRIEPDLDERRLQLELRELFKASGAWQNLLSDALAYQPESMLRKSINVSVLAAASTSPWLSASRAATAAIEGLRLVALAESPDTWGQQLVRILEHHDRPAGFRPAPD